MYIYKITNLINNKIYIGLSTKSVEESTDYYGSGLQINSALKKYGKDNFIKEILEQEIIDEETLCNREIYWINFFKSNNREIGYNIHEGGKFGGWNKNFNNHPNCDEIRAKLSKAGKGRIFSEESKEKIKQSMIGKNLGNQSAFKGKKHSKESLEKISKAFKGKKHSKESLEKISKAASGRIYKIIKCPHCDASGGIPAMMQHHFDNCPIIKPKKIIICLHCNKEGNNSGLMKRYHFDNCKHIRTRPD